MFCVRYFGYHNAGIQRVVCCAWPGLLLSVPVRPFLEYQLPWEKPRNQWMQLKAFRKQPGRRVKMWRLTAGVTLKILQVAQGSGTKAQGMGSYFLLWIPKRFFSCPEVGWLQDGWYRAGGMDSLSVWNTASTAFRCVWECSLEKRDQEHLGLSVIRWGAKLAVQIVLLHGLLEEPWVPSGHFCKRAAELHSSACQYLKIICMPVLWK